MISRGVTLDAARGEIFERMAQKSNANPTHTAVGVAVGGTDEKRTSCAARRTGCSRAAGWRRWSPSTKASTEDDGARPVSRVLARRARARVPRNERHQDARLDKMTLVGRAFTEGYSFRDSGVQELMARDGGLMSLGTTDFSTLLENALYKVLQAAYATVPDTWKRFCNQSSVVDFRTNPRYRMGNFSVLDGLNEHGEFKQKSHRRRREGVDRRDHEGQHHRDQPTGDRER
jgi:hypothetical protein